VPTVLRDPVRDFRWIAIAEGVSFLLLLFIAMPLKYWAGMPIWVRIVGSAHGGLFLLYIWAALRAARHDKWSMKQLAVALIASLLPFGPFVIDHKLKHEEHGQDLAARGQAE
jgi:integral membrane protein